MSLPAQVQDESLIKAATDALHDMVWRIRLDQLGAWSESLKGIAQLDLHILKLIAERPNIILKEICQELRIPNSTLTSAINRLEKRGLLRRLISQRDRRSYELELTDKGLEIKQEHDRIDRMITLRALAALADSTEAQIMIDLLNKVCSAFE